MGRLGGLSGTPRHGSTAWTDRAGRESRDSLESMESKRMSRIGERVILSRRERTEHKERDEKLRAAGRLRTDV